MKKYCLTVVMAVTLVAGFYMQADKAKGETRYWQEACEDLFQLVRDQNEQQIPSDPNSVEYHKMAAQGWKYTAEHYGGICKWLLENKPIYGKVTVGDGATLSDCLIVSGSKEATIDVSGVNSLISNNYFMAIDMDWVNSLVVIDPNQPIQKGSQ